MPRNVVLSYSVRKRPREERLCARRVGGEAFDATIVGLFLLDKIVFSPAIDHWKTKGFDFSNILYQPDVGAEIGRFHQIDETAGERAVIVDNA